MTETQEDAVRSAEFKTIREHLSLTITGIAGLLRVSDATVKNWEKGKYAPPSGVAAEVERLEDYTRRCVDAVAGAARERGMVLVWRTTEEMPPGPARVLGAAWWRSVAARARERVPEVVIGYGDELDALTGSRDATLGRAATPAVLPPTR